ncbi:hypothetical protein BDZ88DRAFT_430312 [Geranomyces variabilis]|nr:hypothetical protein BDZ88DRAFT_430312 [Geranomyces variabilis]
MRRQLTRSCEATVFNRCGRLVDHHRLTECLLAALARGHGLALFLSPPTLRAMSAIFHFQSLLLVLLLLICTCTYIRAQFPSVLDRNKSGFLGVFWKAARIGERLSPYVSLCCVLMAVRIMLGH